MGRGELGVHAGFIAPVRPSTCPARPPQHGAQGRSTQRACHPGLRGQQQRRAAAFRETAEQQRREQMRSQLYLARFFSFVEFLPDLATALVLAVGAVRVNDGTLTTSGIVAFLLYTDMFFSPIQRASQLFDEY
ncbi:ABC transporter transmembrane domain-containing protein [Streptomyces sp. NPDC004752]